MKEYYSLEENYNDFKTMQTLHEFSNRAQIGTDEDRFFVRHIHLHLAESLIYDFGNENAQKIARYILAIVENNPD